MTTNICLDLELIIKYLRLDGGIPTKRQKLVHQFNDSESGIKVLLLSNRVDGCGLNLIGANRLITSAPDWNSAMSFKCFDLYY